MGNSLGEESRAALKREVGFVTVAQKTLIQDLLLTLGMSRLLLNSFVEWEGLRALIKACLLLPSCKER